MTGPEVVSVLERDWDDERRKLLHIFAMEYAEPLLRQFVWDLLITGSAAMPTGEIVRIQPGMQAYHCDVDPDVVRRMLSK